MELDPPVGFLRLRDAVERLKSGVLSDGSDVELAIAEGCESGRIIAGYKSLLGADTLDPAIWRRPNWRTFFETGEVLLTLPLLEPDGKPAASGFTAQCSREIFVRRDSFEAFIATLPRTKKKTGRTPHDRGPIDRRIRELMDHHGDFSKSDVEWNSQARLLDTLEDETGLSRSTLYEIVPPIVEAWRHEKSRK